MTTAVAARRSALTRAADEDDAHDDARATADELATNLVHDLEQLARQPSVTAELADQFADAYCGLVAHAAVTSARPIVSGLTERAHGGLSAAEARRLERITRQEVARHRDERRVERQDAARGREGAAT